MAQFLGDIAFMIEVLIVGLGLVALHFNKREGSSYLKWAGRLMITAGVLGMICTSFFYFKYMFSGEFSTSKTMTMTKSSVEYSIEG